MTEYFEVISLIEDMEYVLKEVRYEAATRPGDGIEFEAKLLQSAKFIKSAITGLREAAAILHK